MFCTKAVVISIRATDFVRCREVVLLSEGPLWEVRLYITPSPHLFHFAQRTKDVGMHGVMSGNERGFKDSIPLSHTTLSFT